MKPVYATEILLLLLSGISAVLVYIGKWYLIVLGILLMFLDSYVLVTTLKRQTLKEYIEASQKNKDEVENE